MDKNMRYISPNTLIFVGEYKQYTVKIDTRPVVRLDYNADLDVFNVESDNQCFKNQVPGSELITGNYQHFAEVVDNILPKTVTPLVVAITNSARAEINLILEANLIIMTDTNYICSRRAPSERPTLRVSYNNTNDTFRIISTDDSQTYFVPRTELVGDFRNFGEVMGQLLSKFDTAQVVSVWGMVRWVQRRRSPAAHCRRG